MADTTPINKTSISLSGSPPAGEKNTAALRVPAEFIHELPHGKTWYSQTPETCEPIVVKCIHKKALTRSTLVRIEHECSVRQQITSPYLSPVTNYENVDGDLQIIMPRILGISLEKRLGQGSLSTRESLLAAKHVFLALGELHRRGVLHRDVRPCNIITNPSTLISNATLVDIGTVRTFNPDQLMGERERSVVTYMSPEQSGSIDCDVGPPSDIYAAGIILFECLAGRPPFEGANAGTILFEHLTAKVPDLRTINPAIPRVVDELVQRLLKKDPHDRYQLADAVAQDLDAILVAMAKNPNDPQIVIGTADRRFTITEPSFVARSEELRHVTEYLANTRRGDGNLLYVEGESGSGKSRLLTEVAMQARRDGFWVLRGQGTTQVAQSPFHLLSGVVDGFISNAQIDPDLITHTRTRLGTHLDALCAAIPALRKIFDIDIQDDSSPAAFGETRTINALAHFIDALGSSSRPTIVILDDCQWADELTYKLIQRWQTLPSNERRYSALLVAFRSEEVLDNHALRRTTPSETLALSPLQEDEVKQLVESMAGKLPEEAIVIITRLAAGSPFMASAVLSGLVETRALIPDASGWRIDAVAIADAGSSRHAAAFLSRRIDLLPAETIRLLSVGAVIGKEFAWDIAATLTGLAPAWAYSALAFARDRRLIWTRPDGANFAFVHDQIRATLLSRLSPSEQNELHLQAASHLQRNLPEQISDIAYHFDAAGESGTALPYALKAAEEARKQFSLEIAERQYRIALRGISQADRPTQFRVAEGLGDTLMLRGQYAEAAPYFEFAAKLADDRLAKAQIQSKLAELSFKRGDMEGATSSFEEALRTLGRYIPRHSFIFLGILMLEAVKQVLHTCFPKIFVHRLQREPNPEERMAIRLFSQLTYGCWYARSKVQCLCAHLRGLNLAEQFSPTPELAHTYSEHAPVMCLVPLFPRAIKYAQRSLEMRKAFKDVWGQGQTLNFYAVVLYAASQYRECIEKGREAVRLLERTGDYWQVHIARYQVAAALYRLGDVSAALEECQINHRSGLELGDEQASGIILDVWARASAGTLDSVILEVELARKRHDQQGRTQVLFAEGISFLYASEFPQAIESLHNAVNTATRASIQNAYTLPAWAWLATAYRMQLEALPHISPKQYRRLFQQAKRAVNKALATGKVCQNDLPRSLREAALLFAMQGKYKVAQQYFLQSLTLAKKQQAMAEVAETLLDRSRVGQVAGWSNWEADAAEARNLQKSLELQSQSQKILQKEVGQLNSLSLADRFDSVLAAGHRIASALSQKKIFEESQAAALRLLRGEQCTVLQAQFLDGEVSFEPILGATSHVYDPLLIDRAVEYRRPVIATNNELQNSNSLSSGGVRSALYVPILVRGRIAACLYLTHCQVGDLFKADEERLANFIATIAGAALENAEGFEELESLNATLEHRVADRTAAAEARAFELSCSNRELERTAKELRLAEEQLREAKDAAEAANAAKSQFLATMSHEIRTPMNGILGMTEVTLRSSLTSQQRNYLSIVRQSGETLLELLNDILDLSKIEAGKMELENISYDVQEVIGAAARLMGVFASQKGVELLCQISPDVPGSLLGDSCRLRQIIINLIGNAIKFTDEGEVQVSVEVDSQNEMKQLHISVRDTGPGIPADKCDLIFESFRQSDSTTTRRYGGTGLGLSISAKLVSLMQGKIWVESELGTGSTFHVTLPLITTGDENQAKRIAPQKTVIVCSSHNTSQKLCHEILTSAGTNVELASSLESLQSQLAHLPKNDAALVLIDIPPSPKGQQRLAGTDLQFLANTPTLFLLPPSGLPDSILLPTSSSHKSLTKPFTPGELLESLIQLESPAAPTSPSENRHTSLETSTRPFHILLADDGIINQEVATALFDIMGHTYEVVSTGQEAIDAYQHGKFDIIFMDLEMPVVDGIGATKKIRELEASQSTHTPIVAMTAHAIKGFRERCLEAGMDDFITKPIRPEALTAIFQSLPQSHTPEIEANSR
ncbi:MAG: ATP-binding protein [Planctomycetaceae bacterium]